MDALFFIIIVFDWNAYFGLWNQLPVLRRKQVTESWLTVFCWLCEDLADTVNKEKWPCDKIKEQIKSLITKILESSLVVENTLNDESKRE